MVEIRTLSRVDVDASADALADAFAEDPQMLWLFPKRGYPSRMRHMFRFMLDHALPHGAVDTVTDSSGSVATAIWLPPGHWKVPTGALLRGIPGVLRTSGLLRMPRLLGRLAAVEKVHPAAPDHWYLEALGVVRSRQGQGLGSALLSRRTAQFDAAGLPAYLEVSNERNIPLYERHGFTLTKTLTFPDAPPHWMMWRDPR